MSDQPPVEPPVPVPATESTTARDVASDLADKARDDSPALPPPGTVQPTFLQSAATHSAIVAWIFFGLIFVDAWIDGVPPSTEAIKLGYRGCVVLTLVALGIYKSDTSVLRWK